MAAVHLVNAIASSERHRTTGRAEGGCGRFSRMGPPSNGQLQPLGAEAKADSSSERGESGWRFTPVESTTFRAGMPSPQSVDWPQQSDQ